MPEEPTRLSRPVVVIDDELDDLMLLRRALAKTGVAEPVFTFTDSAAALASLATLVSSRGASPTERIVVFCDLRMPGLDGFAILQRIRALEFSARICVIIVSGCALESDVERARLLGADGYLEKIPSLETLVACLEAPSFASTGPRSQLFAAWEASREKHPKS